MLAMPILPLLDNAGLSFVIFRRKHFSDVSVRVGAVKSAGAANKS
jgi:hypothetical protein